MPRRTLGLLLGCLVSLVLPAAASAVVPSGSPATVGVRVEGLTDTLVSRTAVTTTTTTLSKDGNPAHTCTGTSSAGALELATGGAWGGTWGTFGQSVDTVKGETWLFTSANFWSLFINGYAAAAGVCGNELQPGDELLVAAIPQAGTTGVLKLTGVPATVKPGVPFAVTVTRLVSEFLPPTYAQTDSAAPAPGVTIASGTTTALSDADGKATLTLSAGGPATVRATKTGEVRSIAEPVCVTDGADGFCGTIKPGATTTTTAAPAAAEIVVPPAPDLAPALPSIGVLAEQARFTVKQAPRELKGSVAVDASGIKDVLLRLTRRNGKTCDRYDGATTAWLAMPKCGTENGTFFSIGATASWSYLLPKALTKGRYVLDVRTVDGAGNVTRGAERGGIDKPRTRVVFHVR